VPYRRLFARHGMFFTTRLQMDENTVNCVLCASVRFGTFNFVITFTAEGAAVCVTTPTWLSTGTTIEAFLGLWFHSSVTRA
jgi:hypothetical protein